MKWSLKDPAFGDIVRVMFGEGIYHYGIYASDEEIYQFGLAPNRRMEISDADVRVLVSDIDEFLSGGFLEVGEPDFIERFQKKSPSEVIKLAKARLGEGGYNILYNNCEHYANACYFGKKFSTQADSVRELFRNLPIVDVYLAVVPDGEPCGNLYPPERNREVFEVRNPEVKKEKYYAWRLLEYGLERSLGLKIKKMEITKTPSGKWVSPSCKFSISHSDGVVAVVISRAEVGIDIERLKAPKSDSFANRILNEEELCRFDAVSDEEERVKYIISSWTSKEALFKTTGGESFIPSSFSGDDPCVKTQLINMGGVDYMLSVATDTPEKIKINKDIDLEK